MDISGRLPMNPWLFIVLYIGLTSVGALTSFQSAAWAMLATAFAAGLHLAWIVQAGLYSFRKADEQLGAGELRAKRKRIFVGAALTVIMSFLILMLEYFFLLTPDLATGAVENDPRATPFILTLFLSFFALIFQAAKTLCQAEAKATGERIFVTCLLLFYLVIGAPFLFKRLKRLHQQEVEGLGAV